MPVIYFEIPFDKIPMNPPYLVWFTSFSDKPPESSNVKVDEHLPVLPPFVVGVTTGDPPEGVEVLGRGLTDEFLPLPPLPSPIAASFDEYKEFVRRWVQNSNGIHRCSYFTIHSLVPPDPAFRIWYATWSRVRPTEVAEKKFAPLAICAIKVDLPDGATALTGGPNKDPPPPPPPSSLARLSDYGAWLAVSTARGT